MRKQIWLTLVCIGLLLFGSFQLLAANTTEVYVSAAISMKDALAEIQKNYENKRPNVKLVFNLGSSGQLQTQIEQGAPADLFISAALKQMDELEKKNLLQKGTRKNLLENQLVMVVEKDSKLGLKDFKDLAGDAVKQIGVGAPESVPAGQYAQQSLKTIGVWDKIQGKVVYGTNVRAVLTYVETGNADAGLVYRTDSIVSDKVKVAAIAPAGSHEPIIYPAAVLAGAKQPKEAADFLAYLSGPEGKTVFEKYGFVMYTN
jgi:molybdate transport system substrate-binding protein